MQLGLKGEPFKLWSRSELHCTTNTAANPWNSFVETGINYPAGLIVINSSVLQSVKLMTKLPC